MSGGSVNGRERSRGTVPLLVAMALVAAWLVMGVDPAGGAYPGANGKIAYQQTVTGAGIDIFAMEPDGSGQTNLTNTAGVNETHPVWSPDGQQIAYVREGNIWVMNADGSGQTNLTQTPNLGGAFPSWSPDGSRIVFSRGATSLWVVNSDGSGLALLVDPPTVIATQPVWSPLGDRIAYTGDNDIWAVDADGTDPVNLTNSEPGERYPDWAPDGSRIVFERFQPEEIWTMDPDGTDQVNVTPAGGSSAVTTPAWSPDGTRIVLQFGGIRTMDPDGTDVSGVLAAGQFPDWQPLQETPTTTTVAPTTTTSSTSTTVAPTTTTSSTSTTVAPTTTTSSTSTTVAPTTTTSSTSTTLAPTTTTSSTSTTVVPTTTTSSTSTTLAPTTTTSSTSTTVAPTTTTSSTSTTVAPTTTTLPPSGTDFFDETALSNGTVARLTGTLTCEAGRRFRIEVTLTQGDVVGERTRTGRCTGEPVRFRMTVRGDGFVTGPARIEGTIQIGTPGTRTIESTFPVDEMVLIQVPEGFLGQVVNAFLTMDRLDN